MDPRSKQGRQTGGRRAAGSSTARAPDALRGEPTAAPGSMSAMRMDPDFRPPRADDDARDEARGDAGEMPGEGSGGGRVGHDDGASLPRFGGRLAGLGPLGAPPAGEMPAGDMNGGMAALLDDASGADALDRAPEPGPGMPSGTMDDPRGGPAGDAMHLAMNEGRAEMPTGAMTNGAGGAMPQAGGLRRHEDPDAGGELRRREDPDAGGELGAGPADAGAGGMPSAAMDRAAAPAGRGAANAAHAAGATVSLAVGGEWRLTLSSISLDRA